MTRLAIAPPKRTFKQLEVDTGRLMGARLENNRGD
jgi:hypothetical protein